MCEECTVDVLRLEHEPAEDFGECLCAQGNPAFAEFFLFIRDVITLYHFAMVVIVVSMIIIDEELKLYLFFDFWVQVLLFFSSEFGMFGIIRRCSELEGDFESYWDCMPWYCKVYWALFSAALPSTVLSSIIYWARFHKSMPLIGSTTNGLRLLHFLYFMIFYAIYLLFTLVYQAREGKGVDDNPYIYEDTDWDDPKKASFTFAVGLGLGLAIHCLLCFVSMAKMAWKERHFES